MTNICICVAGLPSDCSELKAFNSSTANERDGDYTVLVAGYKIDVYCHLMNESHPKTYINVDNRNNYAEMYGKR